MNSLEYTPFTGAYSLSLDVSNATPGGRVYLPDMPILADKFITGITVYGISYAENANQDPDGNVISSNGLSLFSLTLVDLQNDNFISDLPLYYFMYGGRQVRINRYLVLPNCYVKVPSSGVDTTHIFITFYYSSAEKEIESLPQTPNSLKIQSLSIPVYSNMQNRYYLPDNRVLVEKSIRNIYSTVSGMQVSSPDGIPVVAPVNSFLTLVYKSDIILYRLPVLYLSQWNTPFRLNMDSLRADLPSSYIELSQNIAQTVGDKVVFLNVEYED